jgi:uncharacterized OB-fold protein
MTGPGLGEFAAGRREAVLRQDRELGVTWDDGLPRGLVTLKCARCGGMFEPPRTDQRFCSNACRQAAYRERKLKEASG